MNIDYIVYVCGDAEKVFCFGVISVLDQVLDYPMLAFDESCNELIT